MLFVAPTFFQPVLIISPLNVAVPVTFIPFAKLTNAENTGLTVNVTVVAKVTIELNISVMPESVLPK